MKKFLCSVILATLVFVSVSWCSFAGAGYAHYFSNKSEYARVLVYSGSYNVYAKASVYATSDGSGNILDYEIISKQNGNSSTYTYTATASSSNAASGRYDCRASNNTYGPDHFSVSGLN